MYVYKLPSNALVSIPLDNELELIEFTWSTFVFKTEDKGLARCAESTDDSANTDISFPDRLFHTCMVPSQDAILPVGDKTQMSLTT